MKRIGKKIKERLINMERGFNKGLSVALAAAMLAG